MTPNKTKTPRCHHHQSEAVKQIIEGLIWALASFTTALLASLILLPLVYHNRGYFAIGGEWFLIVAISWGIVTIAKNIATRAVKGNKK